MGLSRLVNLSSSETDGTFDAVPYKEDKIRDMQIISFIEPLPVEWRQLRTSKELAMTWESSKFPRPLEEPVYALESNPDLWNDFADLEETDPEAILHFANTYGWLSAEDTELRAVRGYRKARQLITLERWQRSVRAFRDTVENHRKGETARTNKAMSDALPKFCRVVWSGGAPAVRLDGVHGVAWFQLAEICRQGREIDVCAAPGCWNHFSVNLQGSNRRRYCDDTCKKRAQRARRKPN